MIFSIYIALVRQLLEYLVWFCVRVCVNYVGKLKKVNEWARKIIFQECLVVGNLELHVFCFSERETICLRCRRALMCQKYRLPEASII